MTRENRNTHFQYFPCVLRCSGFFGRVTQLRWPPKAWFAFFRWGIIASFKSCREGNGLLFSERCICLKKAPPPTSSSHRDPHLLARSLLPFRTATFIMNEVPLKEGFINPCASREGLASFKSRIVHYFCPGTKCSCFV